MPGKPIGQSMIEANLINQKQLDELLDFQNSITERLPLGRLAVRLGFIEEEKLAPFLASYFGVPYIDLENYSSFQKEAIDVVPESIAKRFNVLPLIKEDDTLTVAIADPLDLTVIENLRTVTNCRIKSVVSAPNQIKNNIETQYNRIFLRLGNEDKEKDVLPILSTGKKEDSWPIVPSLLYLIIDQALNSSVNYIHIQPEPNRMKIFFRVKKRLENVASYPKGVFSAILKFIKEASNMNTQLNGIPQVGSFICNAGELNLEVGVSIFPTLCGDRIVLEVPRIVE